jgi:hypothetical protein
MSGDRVAEDDPRGVGLYTHLRDLPAHVLKCLRASEAYRSDIRELFPTSKRTTLGGDSRRSLATRTSPRRPRTATGEGPGGGRVHGVWCPHFGRALPDVCAADGAVTGGTGRRLDRNR